LYEEHRQPIDPGGENQEGKPWREPRFYSGGLLGGLSTALWGFSEGSYTGCASCIIAQRLKGTQRGKPRGKTMEGTQILLWWPPWRPLDGPLVALWTP